MIRRAPHQTDYLMVRNEAIRDSTLTFRARGLLTLLLSMPDNRRVNADWISKQGPEGRDAIRSVLRELEAANYLRRDSWQEPGTGQWVHESTVYESPTDPNVQVEPESGFQAPVLSDLDPVRAVSPESGFPASVSPASVSQALEEVPTEQGPTEQGPTRSSTRASNRTVGTFFEAFWTLYPRKKKKGDALKAYPGALKIAGDPQIIIDGVHRAIPDWLRNESRFIPYPASWLRAQGWEDESDVELEAERRRAGDVIARAELGLPDPWALELGAGQ